MNADFSDLPTRIATVVEKETGVFAVAVKDPRTGFHWSRNAFPMRSASLIKLFIMVEAFEQMKTAQLLSDTVLSFTESDRVAGSGLLQELPAGTSRTVLELVELMITESDNIATNLLIDLLGMSAINARIRALGCTDTILRRRMMDFAAAAAGRENTTSVTDVVHVLSLLHDARCVNPEADSAMRAILGRQTDRCKIPFLLPTAVTCQNKTGELPGAEHDAGIVLTPQGSYILAIMSDDLADSEQGCQAVAHISRSVYDWYAKK
jgi:beta-lactamase class A